MEVAHGHRNRSGIVGPEVLGGLTTEVHKRAFGVATVRSPPLSVNICYRKKVHVIKPPYLRRADPSLRTIENEQNWECQHAEMASLKSHVGEGVT